VAAGEPSPVLVRRPSRLLVGRRRRDGDVRLSVVGVGWAV
jgi:hypothetical protein